MSRTSWIAPMATACALVSYAIAAADVGAVIAKQHTAPARLIQTHACSNLLKAGQLENRSEKPITSYRIGWAYVYPEAISLHEGALISVPRGIKLGDIRDVPVQSVPFDEKAQRVIFFVAELGFADGSQWRVKIDDIAREAGLNFLSMTATR
jgi:hypothetical protein